MADPLIELGRRVSALRRDRGMSREELARRAGLSGRFLAEVEAGRGNIAFSRLLDLCTALGVPLAVLAAEVDPSERSRAAGPLAAILSILGRSSPLELEAAHRWLAARKQSRASMIALIGLRGAGKTTLGPRVAARLRTRFVELDERIEKLAGLRLQHIFELHGEEYYRRVEFESLRELLAAGKRGVVATGGGIVTRAPTYDLLRARTLTVWLKANPRDHWNRVLEQDPRPMANYPNAFEQLEKLLRLREPLYAQADFTVDTTALGVEDAVEAVVDLARARLSRARDSRR